MATRIKNHYEHMTPEEQFLVAGFRKGDRLTVSGSLDMIVEEIHTGGFGVVAIGTNSYDSGRPEGFTKGARYVLKGIRGDVDSTEARANFEEEAFQWVRLWPHRNITPVVGLTTINNRLFLILHYMPMTLASRIGKVSLGQMLQYALQIATGLAFLHKPDKLLVPRGPIIHRDLKPANVLIGGDGVAQITDFGLVKSVESALHGIENPTEYGQGILQTSIGGTYPYMAPEQWTQAKITPAVDIFAFGVMLCEMLTGGGHPWGWHYNWRDSTLMENLAENRPPRAITTGNATWERSLELLYRACLAPHPADRPTSEMLVAQLQDVIRQQGVTSWVPVLFERTNPNIASQLTNLGITYRHMQRYDDAVAAYQRALDLNSSFTEAWTNLGITYRHMQRYDDAVAAYQRALDLNPSDADAWNNLGNTYKSMQQYDDAVDAYQRAIDLNPSFALAWTHLGITYDSMQRYADAVAAFQQAIALNPSDASAWTNLGNTYDSMQQYADAVAAFQQAIDLNPSYADAWYNLGNTYKSMQRYADAVDAYQRAIDLDPSDADAWYNLSVTIAKKDNPKAAIQTIDEGLQHCPTDSSLYQLKHLILSQYLHRPQEAAQVIADAQAHRVHLDV